MPAHADAQETWERHRGAACAPLSGYRRREPEKTLLYQVVQERLETFLATARDRSAHGRGLPAFVERELRAYLDCGILAHGFARVRCKDCGFERLVAFSCKASVCPSCATRRMEDGADHLVRNVLPPVPVRQWILSLPRRLRFLAARHPAFASRLLDVFTRAVFAWQRRLARTGGAAEPRTGGVTAVQRFGGSVNLNVHFHTLVPDGVFAAQGADPARFYPIRQPRDEDVAAILARIVRRTVKLLAGFDLEPETDALASLQAAEVDPGGYGSRSPSTRPDAALSSMASRSTLASASTPTTVKGGSTFAVTSCALRWRSTTSPAPTTTSSSTAPTTTSSSTE